MPVIISYKDPEFFEQYNEEVNGILEEVEKIELPNQFPPVTIIPEGLDDETINQLQELDGVIVRQEDDD